MKITPLTKKVITDQIKTSDEFLVILDIREAFWQKQEGVRHDQNNLNNLVQISQSRLVEVEWNLYLKDQLNELNGEDTKTTTEKGSSKVRSVPEIPSRRGDGNSDSADSEGEGVRTN